MVNRNKCIRGKAVIDFLVKQMDCNSDESFYSCDAFHSTGMGCSSCPMSTNRRIGGGAVNQNCALILLRETAVFIKEKSEQVVIP